MNSMSGKNENKIRARVSAVHRERYCLIYEEKEVFAKLKGSLYRSLESFPVVGDYVEVRLNPYGDSVIESVEDRRSYFVRPNLSGHAEGYVKTIKQEILAANYDYAFIVASLNQNFNVNRILRYVSITLQGGGKPIVILTKADLCEHPEEYVNELKKMSQDTEVFVVSTFAEIGLNALLPYLEKDNTIILLGSSGVGKSTLINKLAGKEVMDVSGIREKDGKGRHTTTHRQMIQMPQGATMIDTPGMREIGLLDVDEGMDDTFSDIKELISGCKYKEVIG